MALTAPSTISVAHISIPASLPAFMNSLIGPPNKSPNLYISVSTHSLAIYLTPTSTVNVIEMDELSNALNREDGSALALKSLLETGTAIKVFFDARMPAKILFNRCGITLANKMMELALRQPDAGREWLAGFNKCITQDSGLDVDMPIPGSLEEFAGSDRRMLHLPVLWEKYHDQLVNRIGNGFWISMIREATWKRLEGSRGEGYDVCGARSGWDKDSIEEQRDLWNDDVMMDHIHGGQILGGDEHWRKYDVL